MPESVTESVPRPGDRSVHSSDGQSPPPNAPAWLRATLVAAIGVLAISHLPFVVDGYGETDAALTGIVATLWAQEGRLPTESGIFVERRFRSNPLYVYLLKSLLSADAISRDGIAAFMNGLTAVCGVLLPVGIFLAVRRVMSPAEAGLTTLLTLVAPVVFHSNCIGFPTIPSLLGFVCSILAFQRAIQAQRMRYGWAALSGGLLIFAVLTKADVVLAAPCMLIVVLMRGHVRQQKKFVALACILPIVSVWVWSVFCQVMAPNVASTLNTFQSWSKQWPLHPAGVFSPLNLINTVMAPGIGTAIAFAGAMLACLVNRTWRFAALAAAVCILPTLLFWGMRNINSSRHNLWIVIPVAALVSFVIHRLFQKLAPKIVIVGLICLTNYLVGPKLPTQFTASARWFDGAKRRDEQLRKVQGDLALAVRQPVPNGKLCFLQHPSGPWIAAASLAQADRSNIRRSGPRQSVWHIETTTKGRPMSIWIPNARDRSRRTWNRIHREGWTAIVPRKGTPPFFRVLRNGKVVPWPQNAKTAR